MAAFLGAVVGYLIVRETQFALFRGQVPWISGVVGGMPPFAFGLRFAKKVADVAVAKRAPAWVAEQARVHKLPEGCLNDYLNVLCFDVVAPPGATPLV